jgi:hypothetical protein
MLETRGIATVAIASVLPQVEKTRPPRALMVPFMLGRPFGEPNDMAFLVGDNYLGRSTTTILAG